MPPGRRTTSPERRRRAGQRVSGGGTDLTPAAGPPAPRRWTCLVFRSPSGGPRSHRKDGRRTEATRRPAWHSGWTNRHDHVTPTRGADPGHGAGPASPHGGAGPGSPRGTRLLTARNPPAPVTRPAGRSMLASGTRPPPIPCHGRPGGRRPPHEWTPHERPKQGPVTI